MSVNFTNEQLEFIKFLEDYPRDEAFIESIIYDFIEYCEEKNKI